MEYLALNSFVRNSGEFRSTPLLGGTGMERGFEIIRGLQVSFFSVAMTFYASVSVVGEGEIFL